MDSLLVLNSRAICFLKRQEYLLATQCLRRALTECHRQASPSTEQEPSPRRPAFRKLHRHSVSSNTRTSAAPRSYSWLPEVSPCRLDFSRVEDNQASVLTPRVFFAMDVSCTKIREDARAASESSTSSSSARSQEMCIKQLSIVILYNLALSLQLEATKDHVSALGDGERICQLLACKSYRCYEKALLLVGSSPVDQVAPTAPSTISILPAQRSSDPEGELAHHPCRSEEEPSLFSLFSEQMVELCILHNMGQIQQAVPVLNKSTTGDRLIQVFTRKLWRLAIIQDDKSSKQEHDHDAGRWNSMMEEFLASFIDPVFHGLHHRAAAA